VKTAHSLLTFLIVLVVSGCASIDFDYPRSESVAVNSTQDTYLGRKARGLTSGKPSDESGFFLLSDGVDALAMRLQLIHRAERGIDLQYFIFEADTVGNVLLLRLLEAADRGVRVRLLLDDIGLADYDEGLMALHSHPNIEVRAFNPFHRGVFGRPRSAMTDFSRIHRRMHNKAFVVDNQVVIFGGRNIAEEYFDAPTDAKFTDLDALAVGPVVNDISAMFDTYWNHVTALPVPAFAKELPDETEELTRLRKDLAHRYQLVLGTKFADAVSAQREEFVQQFEAFTWAPYQVVYDSPDKGIDTKSDEAALIIGPLLEAQESAQSELIVVSPYFVPSQASITRYAELSDRGVEVKIVTNSLAAQDQLVVHSGYAPTRKPLLQHGVKLYEIRPDRDQSANGTVSESDSLVSMHTKAFVVDRQKVFFGSFNFDPRSSYLNTEVGVIVESAALAAEFGQAVDGALATRTFEVYLDDKDRLRWRSLEGGKWLVYTSDPKTSWYQRILVRSAGLLPIKSEL
jgi:putative cardiolipin synthase